MPGSMAILVEKHIKFIKIFVALYLEVIQVVLAQHNFSKFLFVVVVMETRQVTSHHRIKYDRERLLSQTDKIIMKKVVLMHIRSSVVVVYGTNLPSRCYFMVYSKLMKSCGNEAYVNHILQLSRYLLHKDNLASLGNLLRY